MIIYALGSNLNLVFEYSVWVQFIPVNKLTLKLPLGLLSVQTFMILSKSLRCWSHFLLYVTLVTNSILRLFVSLLQDHQQANSDPVGQGWDISILEFTVSLLTVAKGFTLVSPGVHLYHTAAGWGVKSVDVSKSYIFRGVLRRLLFN